MGCAVSEDWTIDVGRFYGSIDPKTGKAERIVLPVPGWKGAHQIAAGSTGSGKTNYMSACVALMAKKFGDKIAFVIIDPHMVGFRSWEPRASTIAYGWDNGLPMLKLVQAEMKRRYQVMFDRRIKEWSPEVADVVGPYLVVLIDELAAIMLAAKPPMPKPGVAAPPSAEKVLTSLAQELRKTGGGLMLGTQSPKASVITALILENCPIRWCGRTKRPEQTEAVLESRDYPAHDPTHPDGITLHEPGGCFVDDGFRVRRGRTTGIHPEAEEVIAEKTQYDAHDFGWERVLHPYSKEKN